MTYEVYQISEDGYEKKIGTFENVEDIPIKSVAELADIARQSGVVVSDETFYVRPVS